MAEAQGLQLKRANRELLLRAVRPRFDDWFYTVEWHPEILSHPNGRAAPQNRVWAIIADQSGFADELASVLANQSQNCLVLTPGQAAPVGANLIYLPGLDATLGDSSDRLIEDQATMCLGAIQAALAAPETRLWIVTRGAQAIQPSTLQPAQASLWGLGRVIALEHPEIWGGLIDLDPDQPPEAQITALIDEIRAAGDEDQVAFRESKRLVARLARTTRPSTRMSSFSPDAAYLITGGLGGLGLVTARWMAENGAKHIVLTSRHGLPPRSAWDDLPTDGQAAVQAAAVDEIENAFGVHVEVEAVDVADGDALQRLIQSFGSTRPVLKGVIHTAAVLGNRSLDELRAEDLAAMFRPKILGAINLGNLTHNLDLDFLVLFSSTTALWGSSQLAHYAAANTFMDSFAHFCVARGQPVLSINWGTWEVMRAASQAEQQLTQQFGLEQMPVEAALAILGSLLPPAQAQITVASVDWSALKTAYEARRVRPFLQLLETRKIQRQAGAPSKDASLSEQLKSLNPEDRRANIVEHVRRLVARVISAPDPSRLNITQGLFEMGLDSLMSVELKSLLETSVGQPLPSTLTFNYPTIADLARYLDETVLADQPAPTQSLPPSAPLLSPSEEPANDVNAMSEDELASLLASKLSKLK